MSSSTLLILSKNVLLLPKKLVIYVQNSKYRTQSSRPSFRKKWQFVVVNLIDHKKCPKLSSSLGGPKRSQKGKKIIANVAYLAFFRHSNGVWRRVKPFEQPLFSTRVRISRRGMISRQLVGHEKWRQTYELSCSAA